MNVTAIPRWNDQGVLPPVNPVDPASIDRSPYWVSLPALIRRFATSPQRRAILAGFLRYRADLHALGLTQGFQWLDGSFLEDVERLENQPPNDLDVVTFFDLPREVSPESLYDRNKEIFHHDSSKRMYHVDGYFVQLLVDDFGDVDDIIDQTTYWYSMWSHRRNQMWKGFLKIDLAPVEDEDSLLAFDDTGEGQP